MRAGATESHSDIIKSIAYYSRLHIRGFNYNMFPWVRDIRSNDLIRTCDPDVGLVFVVARNSTDVIFGSVKVVDIRSEAHKIITQTIYWSRMHEYVLI